MSSLQVNARLEVHAGKVDEFKVLAVQCMTLVREKDSGTLQYDWFLNEDESVCVVREAYRDSAALIRHIDNVGDTLAALLDIGDMELEIFGAPSDDVVAATKDLGAKVYPHFQSL